MKQRQKVIHQTDIYHKHLDPDDHWDLACQYALHYTGRIELCGIILDNVPKIRMDHGDPAIIAVSQMNYITGNSIPNAIGINLKSKTVDWQYYKDNQKEFAAVRMIEKSLSESQEKVVIQIVGSCKDVSVAVRLFPQLFRDKCAGIYLNAGVSNSLSKTEYNVSLDPEAFITVLNAPCPVYWLPSHMNYSNEVNSYVNEQYASFYKFKQENILPFLSNQVKNYFIYALSCSHDMNWLSFLRKKPNKQLVEDICRGYRNMWSTAGILSQAGLTVTSSGELIETEELIDEPVFSYIPIEVECEKNGRVTWKISKSDTKKYIFQINDLNIYEECMIKAMKKLLLQLP